VDRGPARAHEGAAHARHQTHTIRLGARRDGTIVGLADRIWLDLGAYNVWGVVLPLQHRGSSDRALSNTAT